SQIRVNTMVKDIENTLADNEEILNMIQAEDPAPVKVPQTLEDASAYVIKKAQELGDSDSFYVDPEVATSQKADIANEIRNMPEAERSAAILGLQQSISALRQRQKELHELTSTDEVDKEALGEANYLQARAYIQEPIPFLKVTPIEKSYIR